MIVTTSELIQVLGLTAGSLPSDATTGYLDALIARSQSIIEDRVLGREVEQASFTEYISGAGGRFMNLRRGPIGSTFEVWEVTYSSTGLESLTTVSKGLYFACGNDANWKLPSYLEGNMTSWLRGSKNYKVTYTAGYNSTDMPGVIKQACLHGCTWMKNKRKDAATGSRDIGQGASLGFKDENELVEELEAMLASFLDRT